MSTIPSPSFESLIENDGKPKLPWIQFFNQCYTGDLGTSWSPNFVNLTQVGGNATIKGFYYQVTKGLSYFRIDVTPATNTSSVSGTTYVDNFPLQVNANGFCVSVSGISGGSIGIVQIGTGRIYVPTWTAVTSVVTILGMVEAS